MEWNEPGHGTENGVERAMAWVVQWNGTSLGALPVRSGTGPRGSAQADDLTRGGFPWGGGGFPEHGCDMIEVGATEEFG